jgi:hypothetical protein
MTANEKHPALFSALRSAVTDPERSSAFNTWRSSQVGPKIDLSHCEFTDMGFQGHTDFQKLDFTGAVFRRCKLRGLQFTRSAIIAASFEECDLSESGFEEVSGLNASFHDCDLNRANFNHATLEEARFVRSNIREARFQHAALDDAAFIGADMDAQTDFRGLKSCRHCRIDRYSLACLGFERGGLTDGNLMVMDVVDDVARLRQQFGGIWSLLHLASLAVFVFPYAWFLIRQWTVARFYAPHAHGETMALWEALGRFVIRGGENWRTSAAINWLPFGTFVLILA